MEIEQTLVIIKPDAVSRKLVGRIISRFEDKFLDIIKIESRVKNETWMRLFYPHIYRDNKPLFNDLCNFMVGTLLIGIILEGPDAISMVRKMVGATDSRLSAVGTIRGDFGSYPVRYNCVHASDSFESARREIELFFSGKRNEQQDRSY
jgi:nucleoside-diphosphate kinase